MRKFVRFATWSTVSRLCAGVSRGASVGYGRHCGTRHIRVSSRLGPPRTDFLDVPRMSGRQGHNQARCTARRVLGVQGLQGRGHDTSARHRANNRHQHRAYTTSYCTDEVSCCFCTSEYGRKGRGLYPTVGNSDDKNNYLGLKRLLDHFILLRSIKLLKLFH